MSEPAAQPHLIELYDTKEESSNDYAKRLDLSQVISHIPRGCFASNPKDIAAFAIVRLTKPRRRPETDRAYSSGLYMSQSARMTGRKKDLEMAKLGARDECIRISSDAPYSMKVVAVR